MYKGREKKHHIGLRELKFFYIIGWILKECILRWRSPAVLSRLNPGLPNGGKCALPKSYTYKYFLKNNPLAKKHFSKSIKIPYNTTWVEAKKLMKPLGREVVLKPDRGMRSIGVFITTDDDKRERILESRGRNDYLAQEYIKYTYELGVFYYKYPTWEKGKIMGIAERNIEDIADPRKSDQYTNRVDLITPKVTDIFNKIIGDKEIYFCRFDLKVEDLNEFKKGKGFKILEANAGPDAVALHALDKNYDWKKQLKLYSEEYMHAFYIAELNKNKPQTRLCKYFLFVMQDEIPLQILKWRMRKIKR
jgi:hypothetical protein